MQSIENGDVIHCSAYGGYLSIYQDAAIAGTEGFCRQCTPTDPIRDASAYSVNRVEGTSPYRTVVEGQGFLCESCGHGVYFDKRKAFQELFKRHDKKGCPHCTWHNKRSPANPIERPEN